jgi:1-deoxy-D-xylulose-5-phosphate synthase
VSATGAVGGLSGYPAPEESPHDLFTTAHAGTAASLAAGLAAGDRLLARPARSVAVVGDGALNCGVAFEALNHAAAHEGRLLLVLNDNGMSIDNATGGLADTLARDRAGGSASAAFFASLGLDYVGPIDGHDLAEFLELQRCLLPRPHREGHPPDPSLLR